MCGIAGSFGHTNIKHKSIVKEILSNIEHRGREGTLYELKSLGRLGAIGANRLPIIQELFNKQPALSPNSKFIIVMNGQVFNYQELYADLCNENTVFSYKFPGDTLVLAAAIEKWGISKAIDKLVWEGVFLVIDLKNNKILAARDHIGIKPLYYCQNLNRLFFASEIKSLLGYGNDSEIKQVEPGSFIEFDLVSTECLTSVKWWRPNLIPSKKYNEIELQSELLKLLSKAIKLRVPKDPYAILLSGGIDSSIILKLCVQFNSNVTAYVLCNDTSPDLPYARKICKDLGVKLVEVMIETSESMFKRLNNLVKTLETWEWHVINHAAPMEKLFGVIRKDNFKVVLTGEGADELFFGYENYTEKPDNKTFELDRLSRINYLHRTNCLRLDRMGMLNGLECRVPFLDRALVEFALSIPPSLCIKDGYNKKPLREILKNIYSEKFAHRKKLSFARGVGFDYGSKNIESVFGVVEYDSNLSILPNWENLPRYPLERLFLSYFLKAGYQRALHLNSRSI